MGGCCNTPAAPEDSAVQAFVYWLAALPGGGFHIGNPVLQMPGARTCSQAL